MPIAFQCPFYQHTKGLRITGECGCVCFRSVGHMQEFVANYCADASGWHGCTLAHSLMEDYDRLPELPAPSPQAHRYRPTREVDGSDGDK